MDSDIRSPVKDTLNYHPFLLLHKGLFIFIILLIDEFDLSLCNSLTFLKLFLYINGWIRWSSHHGIGRSKWGNLLSTKNCPLLPDSPGYSRDGSGEGRAGISVPWPWSPAIPSKLVVQITQGHRLYMAPVSFSHFHLPGPNANEPALSWLQPHSTYYGQCGNRRNVVACHWHFKHWSIDRLVKFVVHS